MKRKGKFRYFTVPFLARVKNQVERDCWKIGSKVWDTVFGCFFSISLMCEFKLSRRALQTWTRKTVDFERFLCHSSLIVAVLAWKLSPNNRHRSMEHRKIALSLSENSSRGLRWGGEKRGRRQQPAQAGIIFDTYPLAACAPNEAKSQLRILTRRQIQVESYVRGVIRNGSSTMWTHISKNNKNKDSKWTKLLIKSDFLKNKTTKWTHIVARANVAWL